MIVIDILGVVLIPVLMFIAVGIAGLTIYKLCKFSYEMVDEDEDIYFSRITASPTTDSLPKFIKMVAIVIGISTAGFVGLGLVMELLVFLANAMAVA